MKTNARQHATTFTTDLLLVEPDDRRAKLIHAQLNSPEYGYCITREPSLSRALQYLRVCLPATILLSVRVPDATASESVAAMAQAAPTVPIVLLADADHELLATQVMTSTAHEYVVAERTTAFELATSVAHAIEWKQLEQKIAETEAARHAAKLARTVVHDINNVLMVISSCGDLAMAKLSSDETACRYLNQIRESAHRAGTLTEKLLSFTRASAIGNDRGSAAS